MASEGMSSQPSELTGAVRNRRKAATLSCAECRRLKLKCSRVFPCDTCIKKGVAAICPDSALTTGKGNRFVLANTDALHERIMELQNRVRQLEDALAEAHAARVPHAQHPLLTEELLQLKRPMERSKGDPILQASEPETGDVVSQVGSLSITEPASSKFFGTAASSWYYYQNEVSEDQVSMSPVVEMRLSPQANAQWLSYSWPFGIDLGIEVAQVRESIYAHLPDIGMARHISDIYFRHAAYLYRPIPEDEYNTGVMPCVYDREYHLQHDPADSHRLAVVCMVLALGTFLDLDQPPRSQTAFNYYHMARAALSLEDVMRKPSVPAIQALFIMSHFMFLAEMNERWTVFGIVIKMAQSLGLHRDSSNWNLPGEQSQSRRALMWEIYTYDSWQSLTYGRPPTLSLSHIDTQMAWNSTKDENGEEELSFHAWKHRFSRDCLSEVHDKCFGASITTYTTLLQMDKLMKDVYVPPSLRVQGFGGKITVDENHLSLELMMQGYITSAVREIYYNYMHRGYFSIALEHHAADPLSSRYAQSVLAAYDSAQRFIGLINSLYARQPLLTERMFFLFSHVFSCAVLLGSIPIKSPKLLPMAESALKSLQSAITLFEKIPQNPHAARVIPVLTKLRERAIASLSASRVDQAGSPAAEGSPRSPGSQQEDDELAALGGMTRLVDRKQSMSPSPPVFTESSTRSTIRHSPLAHPMPVLGNGSPGLTGQSILPTHGPGLQRSVTTPTDMSYWKTAPVPGTPAWALQSGSAPVVQEVSPVLQYQGTAQGNGTNNDLVNLAPYDDGMWRNEYNQSMGLLDLQSLGVNGEGIMSTQLSASWHSYFAQFDQRGG